MKVQLKAGPMRARSFALMAIPMPAVRGVIFTPEGVEIELIAEDPVFLERLERLWRDFKVLVPEPVHPQPRVQNDVDGHEHDHAHDDCDSDCDSGYCMCAPCIDKRAPTTTITPALEAWVVELLAS